MSHNRKKILAVDDDGLNLKILGAFISGAGYDVCLASSGGTAIELAKSILPDVIILDLFLPDMDGDKVAGNLRDDPRTRGIPILFLSSLFDKRDEKSLSLKGNFWVIAKPFERSEVLKKIADCLKKAEASEWSNEEALARIKSVLREEGREERAD
jgi:twitching motility two-component system response regulator PilH